MRNIDTIIVHCSATPADWLADYPLSDKISEIRRWHVEERGWADIGYHYVIDRDGSLGTGRSVDRVGAHTKGHNAHSIGVCLIGGFGSDANDRFADHYTPKQEYALLDLISQLKAEFGIKIVRGHNSFEGVTKACPGFRVKKWLTNRENGTPPVPKSAPAMTKSTSLKGNMTNIVSGGGLAAAATTYDGFDQVERYVILGVGVAILLVGLWLFRAKILKMVEDADL